MSIPTYADSASSGLTDLKPEFKSFRDRDFNDHTLKLVLCEYVDKRGINGLVYSEKRRPCVSLLFASKTLFVEKPCIVYSRGGESKESEWAVKLYLRIKERGGNVELFVDYADEMRKFDAMCKQLKEGDIVLLDADNINGKGRYLSYMDLHISKVGAFWIPIESKELLMLEW